MKNDQWFQPGDKVMRVCCFDDVTGRQSCHPLVPETDFGKTLCVESVCKGPRGNRVFFVGIQSLSGIGWLAACFRKVEEIKLCAAALKVIKAPQPQEAFQR